MSLTPGKPQLLEPADAFRGVDATAGDFWRWAFSDLRDNTVRGVLAEFLVAAAVGRTHARRVNWDDYDVLVDDTIRVEVKSSGYLQVWAQSQLSTLSFGRVAARSWDSEARTRSAEAEIRADVFVFAVQTCKVPDEYDALDVAQWAFYVVPAGRLREHGGKSVGIGWVRAQGRALSFGELAAEIRAVGAGTSDG